MKKYIFYIVIFITGIVFAQDELMYINNKPVSVEEFEKMYTKNLDLVQDPEQKDIDNYRQLFINYKLELEDAYQKKYDTLPKLKGELKRYRNDLAKKYLSDEDIIEQLVKEAYQRMQEDVRVAHILIQVSQDASPQDTLKAYQKIMKIYNKAVKGEDFGKLAMRYSQDPSAKNNKGDLDYINVFHTVYPFETAAYTTPVGGISKPFRTRFGYHIVKVLDKRPARGEIQVAHIMTMDKKGVKKDTTQADAKTRIYEIYNKLKSGKDSFENLAKKYSDDKNSARFGGKMQKFGIRMMIPEVEREGFALQKTGDFSKPFQTKYGWHIIKLLKKFPVPDFDKIKHELRSKVMRDERSKMGKEKLLKRIEKQFPVTMTGSLNEVNKYITKDFFDYKWQLPETDIKSQILFTVNHQKKVTYDDFFRYLYKRQYRNPEKYYDRKNIIKHLFDRFKQKKLMEYYNENLEHFYPEFARIMQEYKNGLMMFYIKSDMVWDKSIKDTLGLKNYYESNKQKYIVPKQYKILMIQANDKKTAKKILKYLKKGKDAKYIKEKIKGLIIKNKTFDFNDPFVKKHPLEKDKSVIYKENNQYIILHLLKIEPEHIAGLNEIKGKVTNDFQTYLEEKWLSELKQKYPVKINENNWQKIRAKYKK
jgi:peptidyl-prolyl cis-trans isomerase SurA